MTNVFKILLLTEMRLLQKLDAGSFMRAVMVVERWETGYKMNMEPKCKEREDPRVTPHFCAEQLGEFC